MAWTPKASRKQHRVLCKRMKAKKVIFHIILFVVGGSIYNSHTLNHLKELSLDTNKAHKIALKLQAYFVLYAHKLTTTRRALVCLFVTRRERTQQCP